MVDDVEAAHRRELGHLQAKIDALMFEYCPEDMTEEQLKEYEVAVRVVHPSGKVIQSGLRINMHTNHWWTRYREYRGLHNATCPKCGAVAPRSELDDNDTLIRINWIRVSDGVLPNADEMTSFSDRYLVRTLQNRVAFAHWYNNPDYDEPGKWVTDCADGWDIADVVMYADPKPLTGVQSSCDEFTNNDIDTL